MGVKATYGSRMYVIGTDRVAMAGHGIACGKCVEEGCHDRACHAGSWHVSAPVARSCKLTAKGGRVL